ncbi:MAG: SIS domain-containing protein [Desulfobacterales bacterium]|jgi:D-sedoheptulose 7-phosphate isomerase|nr:SIS domain-containing protein [Desulfobacterales bacterium]
MSLKENAESYYSNLSDKLEKIQATRKDGSGLDFFAAIESAGQLAMAQTEAGRKIIFIGNGASASIASHMSTDFWKNGSMRAIAFNDAALLTCLSNDCGYENVFGKSVEMFADEGDILVAISSSGKSENILNGVREARKRGVHVVTLSGFGSDNPLCGMGDINFYVPDGTYGAVEILHLSVCHCILDIVIMDRDGTVD